MLKIRFIIMTYCLFVQQLVAWGFFFSIYITVFKKFLHIKLSKSASSKLVLLHFQKVCEPLLTDPFVQR